jgi:hypothetical protein
MIFLLDRNEELFRENPDRGVVPKAESEGSNRVVIHQTE